MKIRSTLALLLLFAALCGAYWGMQHMRARRAGDAAQARRLFQFSPAEVTALGVKRIDGPMARARRQPDGAWQMTEPDPTIRPLNPLWDRVAANLAGFSNERTVAERPQDLKQYGLEPPALTVTAEAAGSEPVTLVFGDIEPTQRHRYARLNDGPVFLATTESFFELNRSMDELRHRFMVDDREANILDLQFAWIWTGEAGGKTPAVEEPPQVGDESVVIRVQRENPQSPWRMTQPATAPANQEAVDALLQAVQFSVGRGFVEKPENLSDYGLKPARARITVTDDKSGKAQTILVGTGENGNGPGGVFVQRAGETAVFIVDAQLYDLFPRSPLEWRERRLLTRRVSDLTRIDYRAADDAFVLAKDGTGGWVLESPKFDDVNTMAVSGYLAVFKETTATDILGGTPDQYGLDTPEVTIDLAYEDGQTARILLARDKAEPDKYYATQDTGAVITLTGVAATALVPGSGAFKSRDLLRFDKGAAVRVECALDGARLTLEKRHGQWIVTGPVPATQPLANQSDMDTLFGAVNPLQADSVEAETAPADLGPYGLTPPVFAFTVTVQDEKGGETVLGPLGVGAVTPDNSQLRFAAVAGKTGVFRVKQAVMEGIREAFAGISPPTPK